MPHYKKAFDIGTYTGNGGQYRVGIPTLRGVGPSGKQAAGSLRFRSDVSTDLRRTVSVAGNKRTWTWSGWIKRSSLASSTNANVKNNLFAANQGSYADFFGFDVSTNVFNISLNNTYTINSTDVIKDSSIWYHVVVVLDANNATAANRLIVYVNNRSLTLSGTIAQTDYQINTAVGHAIGSGHTFNGYYFNGYMSEVYFVDGTVLTPSSFGELNSDGIWVPKPVSGLTYGTNGFYLPMNSSSNYATDQSGNGNNWTPTGFNTTTANTSYDLMTDSPTDYLSGSMTTANNAGNYCTQNPLLKGANVTLSDGNLKAVMANASDCSFGGTTKITSGKWYWEVKITTPSTDYPYIGVATPVFDYTAVGASCIRSSSTGFFKASNATKWNSSSSAYGSSFAAGDTMQIAFDADNGKIYFGKNGTWDASSDPATAANPAFTGISTPVVPAGFASNCTWETNFGQRPFSYTPPTGFTALNTYNIQRPADSSLWFYGDTPDLLWIKNRSTAANNVVTDTVRGVGLNLVTNARAPDLSYPAVSEMNKFGMSIINDSVSIVNGSGNSHVYWTWKANGSSTVTDTSGTITSQVSSNRQAGFSIVSWVYNSSGGTIGHGLGAAPSFIIQRSRTAGYNWDVYHVSLGATKRLTLNTTSASETFTGPWNDTAPTSSVFSSGASWWTNGDNMISYLWTAIPGYSAFGSYAGNGAADGPFVYTGFSPRWLMVKSITAASASNWCIYDVVRQTYNQLRNPLYANATNAEPSLGIAFDIVSNGFKLREGGGQGNDSGVTYIYAAFAETPFKYARAR